MKMSRRPHKCAILQKIKCTQETKGKTMAETENADELLANEPEKLIERYTLTIIQLPEHATAKAIVTTVILMLLILGMFLVEIHPCQGRKADLDPSPLPQHYYLQPELESDCAELRRDGKEKGGNHAPLVVSQDWAHGIESQIW